MRSLFALTATVLAATATVSADASPFHTFCTDRGTCINRPGLIMNGFPITSDDTQPPANIEGGTVDVGMGAKATPVFIVEAGDGVVVFTLRGTAYVTSPWGAWVICRDRRHWLGVGNFPFRCPANN